MRRSQVVVEIIGDRVVGVVLIRALISGLAEVLSPAAPMPARADAMAKAGLPARAKAVGE